MNNNNFIFEATFGYVVLKMREYQKKNNIKGKCVNNAQYLYDILKTHNLKNNIFTKAVILVSINDDDKINIINCGHIVVMIDDDLIDPSYETYALPNKMYFDNIKDLLYECPFEDKEMIKNTITQFLKFKKCEEQINSGELRLTDKEYYKNQADYIEIMMKIFDPIQFFKSNSHI